MLEGVPVGGGSVCLIQNLEFKIQNFGFADSSVTRFARATSSTLEEELDKYKNVIKTRSGLISNQSFRFYRLQSSPLQARWSDVGKEQR